MANLLHFIVLLGIGLVIFVESQDDNCGINRNFLTCGTACPRSCDNYQEQSIICTRQCVSGCFCISGLVEKGMECVPPSECSIITTQEISTFHATVSNAPTTTKPVSSTSTAVPTSSPPVTSTSLPTCSGGKVYNNCGSACPSTCENMLQSCDKACVAGCFCPSRLVDNGTSCIMPELCEGVLSTKLLIVIIVTTAALFVVFLLAAICGITIAVQRKRILTKDSVTGTGDKFSRANFNSQTIDQEPSTAPVYEVPLPSDCKVPISSEYEIPAQSSKKFNEQITMNQSYNCTDFLSLDSNQNNDAIILLKTNEAYASIKMC